MHLSAVLKTGNSLISRPLLVWDPKAAARVATSTSEHTIVKIETISGTPKVIVRERISMENVHPDERTQNGSDKKQKQKTMVNKTQSQSAPAVSCTDYVCLMSTVNESNFPSGASSRIFDFRCAIHITIDRSLFAMYTPTSDASVAMSAMQTAAAAERGNVMLNLKCESSLVKIM